MNKMLGLVIAATATVTAGAAVAARKTRFDAKLAVGAGKRPLASKERSAAVPKSVPSTTASFDVPTPQKGRTAPPKEPVETLGPGPDETGERYPAGLAWADIYIQGFLPRPWFHRGRYYVPPDTGRNRFWALMGLRILDNKTFEPKLYWNWDYVKSNPLRFTTIPPSPFRENPAVDALDAPEVRFEDGNRTAVVKWIGRPTLIFPGEQYETQYGEFEFVVFLTIPDDFEQNGILCRILAWHTEGCPAYWAHIGLPDQPPLYEYLTTATPGYWFDSHARVRAVRTGRRKVAVARLY